MPGIDRTGGVMGLGARLIIRLQFGLGQAIRCEELLHMSRQLQGHRTYFFPGGAFLMGCATNKKKENSKLIFHFDTIIVRINKQQTKKKQVLSFTVASLH